MTTSIVDKTTVVDLERMIRSIDASSVARENVIHIVLLQKFTDQYQYVLDNYSDKVKFIIAPDMMSLSKARNMMLEKSRDEALLDAVDIVAYPDDDCWYPRGFLDYISSKFEKQSDLDFFFCKYSSTPVLSSSGFRVKVANGADVVQGASSNTMFVRSNVAFMVGGFDESLGVGAPNNGGEDLDYSIKSYLSSRLVECTDVELVGHRDKDESLRAKYFQGSHIALKRYALRRPTIFIQYIRKVLVGIFLVLRGEMGLKSFTST